MIPITQQQRKDLEAVGLFKHRRSGLHPQDSNFQITNKEHPSRAKTYYIVEEGETMRFLQYWDKCNNIQRIMPYHLESLKQQGLVNDDKIQKPKTYVPNALIYIANNGDIYMERATKLMIALGFWKSKIDNRQ